ncbi:unnamed protein product [Alopecurus aequalis]
MFVSNGIKSSGIPSLSRGTSSMHPIVHYYSFRKSRPADAIVIDGAWSQSKWAVPVIGPDDFLCGSCDGLICLYTKNSTIKIANLATGEHLHLEKPVKNSTGDHFLFYSFGCHPSTKEYKIIHFFGDRCKGRSRLHIDRKFSIIQVYTLGDEKWRDIRTPEALSLNCVKYSGTINVGGIMYWLTEDTVASWQHALMTFDLSEESFARIELPAAVPEDCAGGAPRRYWIREIDGNVSVATAQVYPSERRRLFGKLQIWTLDNKEEQRWNQMYNIQYPPDYIPGPNLSHGDKIILPRLDGNLYYFEFLGENLNTKLGKMAKLLDFSPRKPGNMQSYIFVKSLVRLDAYKKAGIVRRPKQREGWELKKWEAREHELSEIEKSWNGVHQIEHKGTAFAQRNGVIFNDALSRILDDAIQQQISMKINQIFPNFPNQQPRPLRRLNFVEQTRDKENLISRMENCISVMKVTTEVTCSIVSMIHSATLNQNDASQIRAILLGITASAKILRLEA